MVDSFLDKYDYKENNSIHPPVNTLILLQSTRNKSIRVCFLEFLSSPSGRWTSCVVCLDSKNKGVRGVFTDFNTANIMIRLVGNTYNDK